MIAGRLWSPLYTLLEGSVTSVLREINCYIGLSGLFGPCRVIITLLGKMALPWGNERDFVHSWGRPASVRLLQTPSYALYKGYLSQLCQVVLWGVRWSAFEGLDWIVALYFSFV